VAGKLRQSPPCGIHVSKTVLLEIILDLPFGFPINNIISLSGAMYRYDARNVKALAAQMALTTWHTLLLGVKFEIFSDHDSLQYLFMQKSPLERILSLCEFLADSNFEEVKYVPGPQNVVPDFLSRPWEATANEPASLHMLVKRWPKRKSSRPSKT